MEQRFRKVPQQQAHHLLAIEFASPLEAVQTAILILLRAQERIDDEEWGGMSITGIPVKEMA